MRLLAIILMILCGCRTANPRRSVDLRNDAPSPISQAPLYHHEQQEVNFYLSLVDPASYVEVKLCTPDQDCPAVRLKNAAKVSLIVGTTSTYHARVCQSDASGCQAWQTMLLHPLNLVDFPHPDSQIAESFSFREGPTGGAVSSLGGGNMIYSQFLLLNELRLVGNDAGSFRLTSAGLPKLGNTCYLNAAFQLLAADNLVRTEVENLGKNPLPTGISAAEKAEGARIDFGNKLDSLFKAMQTKVTVKGDVITATLASFEKLQDANDLVAFERAKDAIDGDISKLEKKLNEYNYGVKNNYPQDLLREGLDIGPSYSIEQKVSDLKMLLNQKEVKKEDYKSENGRINFLTTLKEQRVDIGTDTGSSFVISGRQQAADEFLTKIIAALRIDSLAPVSITPHQKKPQLSDYSLDFGQVSENSTKGLTLTINRIDKYNNKNSSSLILPADFQLQAAGNTLAFKSAVVHEGGGNGGHYISYRFEGNQWTIFNDDKVTIVSANETKKIKEIITEIETNATILYFEPLSNQAPKALPPPVLTTTESGHKVKEVPITTKAMPTTTAPKGLETTRLPDPKPKRMSNAATVGIAIGSFALGFSIISGAAALTQ